MFSRSLINSLSLTAITDCCYKDRQTLTFLNCTNIINHKNIFFNCHFNKIQNLFNTPSPKEIICQKQKSDLRFASLIFLLSAHLSIKGYGILWLIQAQCLYFFRQAQVNFQVFQCVLRFSGGVPVFFELTAYYH